MPTLIRLVILLLFLAALAFAGMFALVAFVDPTQKEVTVRIPTRDLLGGGEPALPGVQSQLPAPSQQSSAPAEPAEQPAQ
jgi:hypothetical protein